MRFRVTLERAIIEVEMSSRSSSPSTKRKASGRLRVLERPARRAYVRKKGPSKDCVFCEAAGGRPSAKNLVLFKGPQTLVIVNKYPYNSGHLLVLPRRHIASLEELSLDEYQVLMKVFRSSLQILSKVYQPEGVNAGLNLGSAAGAGVPGHLHWHIVPRWKGDTNFFPLIAETKLVVETAAQSYKRLKSAFSQMGE